MRAAHLQPTRPEWYDRSPLSVTGCFQSNVAPHATVVRYSYTVPSNRKSYFENGFLYVQRGVAAAPAGNVVAQLRYTQFGQPVCCFLFASILTNGVGDQYSTEAGASFIAYPGDNFEGWTVDLSTGGNVAYRSFCKWTEFDA